MKKFLSLISVLVLFIPSNNFAQIIMEENFNYPIGMLYQVSNGVWKRNENNEILVVEKNLTYNGYLSANDGYCIYSEAGSKGFISRSLGQSFTTNTYISFILMLKDNLNINDYVLGKAFLNLSSTTWKTTAYITIKKSASPGFINLGIYKSLSSKTLFSTEDYPIGQPLLIILKYSFLAGSSNDLVSLWVNPLLTSSEPIPNVVMGNGDSDIDHLDSLCLRQVTLSGNLYIDAIHSFTRWSDAPLPVELSFLTAEQRDNKVLINWKTETEVDNYGFDVERKIGKDNAEWTKLGFIPGHGNSNSPHSYSFEDKRISSSSIYFYRLKQIDNDGTFKYSDEIETDVNISGDFQLYQNYPNPFNPETKIKFFIPEEGETTLSLYNAIGQKISTLLQDNLSPGDHEISFDGSILNSGIYFCVLESGGKRKTIKLTFMK